MSSSTKRHSWIDSYREYLKDSPLPEQLLRSYIAAIDNKLHEQWQLGRNLVLLWAAEGKQLLLLVIPHYRLAEQTGSHEEKHKAWIAQLIAGRKESEPSRLYETARYFRTEPVRIPLEFDPIKCLGSDLVCALVRRYSVSLVHERAVALFDAVGFSLLSPLEQVTQLNSLSYSVNSAYSKLLDKAVEITFARTTTGDGFYIWNRNTSIGANVDLYHFVQLILADNAIARSKSKDATVPQLRACFHIGSHYEFYQEEGLSPTTFSYIVGDVTIELARMIEKALPGQILIGDFNVPMHYRGQAAAEMIDTISFMERSLETLPDLDGVELSGDTIESIKCYLTGERFDDGSFGISRYRITDKHGLEHTVYNAKVNISRHEKEPIYLGIREQELDAFDARLVEEVKTE